MRFVKKCPQHFNLASLRTLDSTRANALSYQNNDKINRFSLCCFTVKHPSLVCCKLKGERKYALKRKPKSKTTISKTERFMLCSE